MSMFKKQGKKDTGETMTREIRGPETRNSEDERISNSIKC